MYEYNIRVLLKENKYIIRISTSNRIFSNQHYLNRYYSIYSNFVFNKNCYVDNMNNMIVLLLNKCNEYLI